MIKEVTKFKADEGRYSWQEFTTAEEAKDAARREIIGRYVEQRIPEISGWSWRDEESVTGFKKEKRRQRDNLQEARKDGFENGYRRAERDCMDRILKFYPDIMAKLKEIDEQKVEEKDAS